LIKPRHRNAVEKQEYLVLQGMAGGPCLKSRFKNSTSDGNNSKTQFILFCNILTISPKGCTETCFGKPETEVNP
jgi:hypothetical protein